MNFKPALRFLGRLILLLAGTELAPAACAAFYREWGDVTAFLASATRQAEGRPVLGTWQQVFHLECDVRPHVRRLVVTVSGE